MSTGENCLERQPSSSSEAQDENIRTELPQDENCLERQPSSPSETQYENIRTKLTQDENIQRHPSFPDETQDENIRTELTKSENIQRQPSSSSETQDENIRTELTQDENIQRQPSSPSEIQDENIRTELTQGKNTQRQPSSPPEIQDEYIRTELTQGKNTQRQPSSPPENIQWQPSSSSSSEIQDENIRTELTQGENIQRQPSSSSKIQTELTVFMGFLNESLIMHKVPYRLRQVNAKAYEPNVISIGPYHHGKEHLKEMEDIKKRFFDATVGESRKDLQEAIIPEEERIRKCYVETNELSSEKFVDMVILDGFFIVQLFRGTQLIDLFRRRYFVNEIFYDLLLLENQLPFFVLEEIYKIMTNNEETRKEFTDLAFTFFEALIGETVSYKCPTPKENIKHLLGLIHDTPRWRPSYRTEEEDEVKCQMASFLPCLKELEKAPFLPSLKELKKASFLPCLKEQEKKEEKVKRRSFIRCASKLEEAGISFEMRDAKKDKCSALDIEFKGNGRKAKLRIPTLNIDEHTERMLSNLIAFEQFLPFGEPTYVLDYVKFLDQLIDTEKDVQLLCNSDIFENTLGDDEIVAGVFNLIGDNVHVSIDFHYSNILRQVNDHCNNSWNKHMANLHRNYFNSPWALLSFLAAVLLLFLTFAQTTFTLLTVNCHSCVVLSIVCGVLLVVIALFSCWRFS